MGFSLGSNVETWQIRDMMRLLRASIPVAPKDVSQGALQQLIYMHYVCIVYV
jgi:hypothetical protein